MTDFFPGPIIEISSFYDKDNCSSICTWIEPCSNCNKEKQTLFEKFYKEFDNDKSKLVVIDILP